jgi:hypothetical protein
MANPFDQFDVTTKAGNPFDQFDTPAKRERTTLEAAKDIGAGLVSGAGALAQLPGQLYGLATGDFSDTGLTKVGRQLRETGEGMKSEELKRLEVERAAKIKEATKEGEFSAGLTAARETLRNPELLTNFIAEQVPNLIPGLAVARGLSLAGAGARTAVAGAVGTGATQQGADIGAETFKELHKKLVDQGMSPEEATGSVLGYARYAGLGAAAISVGAQILPGGRAIERALANVPIKGGLAARGKAIVKGGAGEAVSEMIEEGGGKVAQNLAVQNVDPTRSLTEGLGETMGMAAVGGLGLGTAAGVASRREAPEAKPEPTAEPAAGAEPPAEPPLLLEGKGAFVPVALPDGTVAMTREDLAQYEEDQFRKKYEPQMVEREAAPEAEAVAEVAPQFNYGSATQEILQLKQQPKTPEVRARIQELEAVKAEMLMDQMRRANEPLRPELMQLREQMESGALTEEGFNTAFDNILADFERQTRGLQRMKQPKSEDQIQIDQEIAALNAEYSELTKEARAKSAEIRGLQSARGEKYNLGTFLKNKLSREEVLDINPDKSFAKRFLAPRSEPGASVAELVAFGQLDQWLPPNMRKGAENFDEKESTEYIKEKLRDADYRPHIAEETERSTGEELARIEERIRQLEAARKSMQQLPEMTPEELQQEAASMAAEAGFEGAPAEVTAAPQEQEEYFPDQEEIQRKLSEQEGKVRFYPGMVDLGYTRIDNPESPRIYTNVGGEKFLTFEKDGLRTAMSSNNILYEDDRGRVQVGYGEPTESIVRALIVEPGARRQGKAKAALQEIVDLADRSGTTLYMEPAALETGAMSTKELVDFYKQFGFTQAKLNSDKILVRPPSEEAGRLAEREASAINKDPENERIEKELTGKTMLGAAQWAVDNAPNQFAKAIAQKVMNRLNGMARRGIKLEFEVAGGKNRPAKMFNARGLVEYDFGRAGEGKQPSFKLTINGAPVMDNQFGYPPGTRYITVLHELLHVATSGQINVLKGDDPLVKELRGLFNQVVDHFNKEVRAGRITPFMNRMYKQEINALTDPDELLAWGIADRDMQEFLSEIKVGDKTIMDKLVELIRKILNVTKPYLTALDQLVKTTESILDEDVDVVADKIVAKRYSFGSKPGEQQVQGTLFQQERNTRTPEFRKWFGKSKIVDKNGNPRVMYHGTPGNIFEFAPGQAEAIFVSDNPEQARHFADLRERDMILDLANEIEKNSQAKRELLTPIIDQAIADGRLGTPENTNGLVKTTRDQHIESAMRREIGDLVNVAGYGNELYQELQGRLPSSLNIMPLYVKAENPFDYDNPRHVKAVMARVKEILGEEGYSKDRMSSGDWSAIEDETVQEAIKDLGFDGFYVEEGGQKNLAVYKSSQIKSVFNQRPTELAGILQEKQEPFKSAPAGSEEPKRMQDKLEEKWDKMRLGAPKEKPSSFEGVDDNLWEQLSKTFFPQNKNIVQKIDGMRDRFWQRLAQGIADQYRTIKNYDEEAYMKARMAKTIDGALEGILFDGEVKLTDGALDIAKDTKGLLKVLEPIGNEVDRYQIWVALKRDAELVRAGKAPSVPKEIVKRLDELSNGKINGKSRLQVYEQVQRDMNKLNRSVLRIAYKQGLIDKEAYKVYARDINYIPFYKVMEEGGDVQSAATKSGLVNQYFSKALKGGEKPFGDLMENTLRNWSHILSASMKNEAANATVRAAMNVGGAFPNLKVGLRWEDGKVYSDKTDQMVGDGSLKPEYTSSDGKGLIKTMIDGKPAYFEVIDPLLLESIMSIGYMGPKSKFLDVARNFKNMLQFGVTLSPAFKIRNLFRDSISAIAVSDLKRNPFANVAQGWAASDRNNPAHISALAGGAIFNFGSAYEGDQAKLIRRLLDQGVKGGNILDSDKKIASGLQTAWRAYQDLGNKSESANRMALYQQMRDKGMSHLEASFYARDLLDFSMQGAWPAFRLLTQTIPFLNARVQGLYKLGRDGIVPTSRVIYNVSTGKPIEATDKQKAEQFSIVMSSVALASLMLYMAFKDDEEFQKREQWDRDNFWWFKLPGMGNALRIPKPFEIGAFGTMVERVAEQMVDKGVEGKVFEQSLKRMLTDTFAINPIPQVIKPLVDLYANKDSFTGAPIETAGMERLSKAERIAEKTSPLAIALSKVTNVFLPESTEISPVQADYAIKGYLGWLGGTASWTSHYAVMPFSKSAYPDNNWTETLSMGFIKSLPATQSKYVTAFYENNKQISQAYADMRHFAQLGQADKVQEILKEKGDKIAMAKFYDNAAKDMSEMRKTITAIRNDQSMPGDQKKEEIDRMKVLIGEIARQMEEARIEVKKQFAAAQ